MIAHSNAATLSDITLAASGSGDDSSAYSDIRLYVDSNGNGLFDPGVDTPFGSASSAFPADDGTLTFSGTLNFAPNETKRLLVVAKLNGPVPASFGQTFDTTITAINATGFMHSGLPTATVAGIAIAAPALTVAATGALQSVFCNASGAGGLGLCVADFLLSNNAVAAASLNSITVAAAGSIFDQTDLSLVALYEDSNANGFFDPADTLYGTAAGAFAADDGSLTFSQAITFAPSQSRRFFLVLKLAGLAAAGSDFWCRISALGLVSGTEAANLGTLVQGLTILAGQPALEIQRAGTVASGGVDTLGNVPVGAMQTVSYTIANTGTALVQLTGTPVIELIAGLNVSFVQVSSPPASTIAAGGSTSFTLQYTVAAPGAFDYRVNIASTDPATPYTWQAQGTATASSGGGGGGGGNADSGGCSTSDSTTNQTSGSGLILLGLGLAQLVISLIRQRQRPRPLVQ